MDIDIEKLDINELNSLPIEMKLAITNKYQSKPAQFKCTACGKDKFAVNAFIIFGKDQVIKDILCYKCHQQLLTLKKLGPNVLKRMQKKGK
ncbi:MAG: hypothetical protein KJ767_00825 [Nanoarchaeota archaeon]|nr:hypothetical protein [Nanoarchaeota archaeon]